MSISAWTDLRPGDQLGNLEYLIYAEALADYQQAVHADSQFPNLAADDCRALLLARCGPLPLTTVWQRQDFLRPPILGRRIQVGGWVREMRQRNHQRWLRVAAFAVDEIGTEILRSEAVYLIGGDGAAAAGQPQQPAVALTAEPTAYGSLPTARSDTDDLAVGDALTLGMFAIPDGDRLAATKIIGQPTGRHQSWQQRRRVVSGNMRVVGGTHRSIFWRRFSLGRTAVGSVPASGIPGRPTSWRRRSDRE